MKRLDIQYRTNRKKFFWLLKKKKEQEIISNIKNIIKFILKVHISNEMSYKFNRTNINSNKCENLINVALDPNKFKNNFIKKLIQTNDKWFINLSNNKILVKITKLL